MKNLFTLFIICSFQLNAQKLDSIQHRNDSITVKQKTASSSTSKGYAIMGFFNDTLFKIHNDIGGFSALERATAINQRIQKLKEVMQDSSAFTLKSDLNNTQILFGDKILLAVSDKDAELLESKRQELAQTYMQLIAEQFRSYKQETSLSALLKNIGIALLIISVTYFLIKYVLKLFRLISIKIYEQKNKRIKGIKIRNYTLFDATRQVNALINLNSILKWLVLLFIIYISIPLLFGVFPWTKDLGNTLFGYVLSPLKRIFLAVVDYLPNLITIAVIIFIFRYVLRGIKYLKTEIESENLKLPGFYPDWASPTYQIIRVLVVAFMIVVIFPYLPGSDSPIFKGVSVFLGFLFTFGSAGSLSNLISGIILTYMRLYKIGDRIKIGTTVGDVVEKNILVTRIKTIKNEIVSVPNSTVMHSHTINYTSEAEKDGLIIHTTITIGYDVPWKLVHEALMEAAKKTTFILKDPKPFVLQTSLNDFYVAYEINAYTNQANKQALIYSELHQLIQDSCNERSIEIMSPHYTAARDGNSKAVPDQYLPKAYRPEGFIIRNNTLDEK